MPCIEKRLEAITPPLEVVAQMQQRTERIVSVLAGDQAETARIMSRIAVLVGDREQRLRDVEGA